MLPVCFALVFPWELPFPQSLTGPREIRFPAKEVRAYHHILTWFRPSVESIEAGRYEYHHHRRIGLHRARSRRSFAARGPWRNLYFTQKRPTARGLRRL